jgi:lysophospholipase L1-like esterase
MVLQNGQTLLFIGDSITDAGRARPVGDSEKSGLGGGYPSQVNTLLSATYPERKIRILNTGISGHTVRHLAGRWERDVLDLKPDYLSIMIGTNDVWRQFDRPDYPEIHVLPEEFEKTLRELVLKTKPTVKGITLLTPFYVEPDVTNPMRKRMDSYGKIVQKIAKETGCAFGNTQEAYNKALKSRQFSDWAGDKVHPNAAGHMILARTFLKTIGYKW